MPGAKPNIISVFTPVPGSVVRSPLTVRGEAPGSWFFEASFPVRLRDAGGREIVVTTARAQSDWMTEKLVPFEAVLEFGGATGTSGTLVLEKDNPSGLPENADAILIKVQFARGAGDSS